mgnify:CR=1 FL=1
MSIVKSVSDNQDEIINGIIKLHCPDGIECDVTYGNGVFYKNIQEPKYKFDIDPQCDGVIQASSIELPLEDKSINSLMFDPPFLTYVRQGREGNGSMIMFNRFAGYWTYDELADHYRATINEAHRVLKHKGILIVKCQDIIHNHKLHCTHANVINWVAGCDLRLLDMFILTAKHRLPAPNRQGKQKHARIFHSYFLVFIKTS